MIEWEKYLFFDDTRVAPRDWKEDMKRFTIAFVLLKKNLKTIFLFELIYKLVTTAIFTPLMVGMIRLALWSAGIKYLTNRRLVEFLLKPSTILILLIMLLLAVIFIIIEMTALIYCYDCSYHEVKADITDMFKAGIKAAVRMFAGSNMKLIIFVLAMVPIIHLPIISGYITTIEIPEYFTEILLKPVAVKAVLIAVYAVLCIFAIRWIYSLHYFILEQKRYRESCISSVKLNGLAYPGLVLSYFIWEGILIAVFFIVFIATMFIITNSIKIFVSYDTTYSLSLFMGREIYGIWLKVYSCVTVPVIFAFFSGSFYSRKEKMNEAIPEITGCKKEKKNLNKIKKILAAAVVMSAILNLLYINNDFGLESVNVQLFRNALVAAHRGASAEAPENTLAAVEQAIANRADYAEIDVQETKDGVVILLHDSNLKRTTGVDAEVSDWNYKKIRQLDAGSWFSEEYKGEVIPTLAETLEAAKGKIKLNIEIKLNGTERNLVQSVVRLIEIYDMTDDCVITSFQASALKEVKRLNADIRTGYILKVAYGDFSGLDYADALSVNYSFATSMLVNDAHDAGKEVYVWTINSEEKIINMISNGVDMVITDRPAFARETITSYEVNPWLVDMIQYLVGR